MTNTDTRNAVATTAQIKRLSDAGCEIIRLAVPDEKAVNALPEILEQASIPVIADIHFDYRLALQSIKSGIHGIRINPGNIGGADRVKAVAEAAGEAGIPIRVGANSGSLPKGMLEELIQSGLSHNEAMSQALCSSALGQCELLEKYGFRDIKVSLKASDVAVTLAACRRFADETDYPLHLGVTEAGTLGRGIVKSAVGIGALLLDGIGDTIRVSLTADPVEEVLCGIRILESCGLRPAEPDIVSCPTCGRTEIDLIGLAERVEALVASIKNSGRKINLNKIAVMGCVVNGPGEAKDADLGIAGGQNKVVLIRHGQIIGTYDEERGFELLKTEILKNCS
jgi:(E)-4-hydroxy-3-methylbut-2-enyl-diphosphate synthase